MYIVLDCNSLDPEDVTLSEFLMQDGTGGWVIVTLDNNGDGTYTGQYELSELPSDSEAWAATFHLEYGETGVYERGVNLSIAL